ncbi:hypothetical protein HC251_00515 [Iamia sp. SCSIO 61187]|uniref:hypothetical protein n=1 Tax=Iamia sp. SCSIO 61187 TaxID=2722752 RepID=UPI001C626475|nr:hypothetical protein [Iamia sp. SCSIO 61187]QYG91064.1 hypothetical protein HC251_00515 [Iamia sp. SCSIO 61187]
MPRSPWSDGSSLRPHGAQQLVDHVLANRRQSEPSGKRDHLLSIIGLGQHPFGPFTPEVLAGLERLITVDAGAPQRIEKAWSWSALPVESHERTWTRLGVPAAITGQLPDTGDAVLSAVVWRLPSSRFTLGARSALADAVRSIAYAHLLRRDQWSARTHLLAAAIGELSYPWDHPLLQMVCSQGPVGLHLLHAAVGQPRCRCRRPLPGLSASASDVAYALVATASDWAAVLDVAESCVA